MIISIIIIMIPQDQGSAWRHSRGQLLLLPRYAGTGAAKTQSPKVHQRQRGQRQCHWEPSQIVAGYKAVLRAFSGNPNQQYEHILYEHIWTIEEWVVKPEKRSSGNKTKCIQKVPGTTVAASQHIGKIQQEKNTPSQLSLHLIQAGGPCRHTGLPN